MTSEPQLQELVPGVQAWIQPDGTWWINNAGAVHSGGEVVLVDTCATARRTRLFLDALDAATGGAPIRLAVNTHLHGDHVYGNALLPDETVIVAHEHTRQGILQDFILANTPPVWSPTPEWGVDAVRALIPMGTTAAILGASGAGKSTLANALLGEDRQKTGAVREDDGRGRHITVRRDLLALGFADRGRLLGGLQPRDTAARRR